MEEKKITINGTDYQMKPGMRAIVIFEYVSKKAFEIKTDTDILAYIYSCILAAKPDCSLDFEEMVDAFDDAKLFAKACDIALNVTSFEKIVNKSNEGGTEPKKG